MIHRKLQEQMNGDSTGSNSSSTGSRVISQRPAAPAQPIVRAGRFEEILQLRYDVLRAGLPPEAAVFEGDRSPSSRHYGAFADDRNVGCATLHLNRWQDEPAWQLRGMATAPDYRNAGLGRTILAFVETDLLATHPVHLLWCNARVPAVKFYQRLGWQVVSEEFEIPTAGPHHQMVKRL
jgi:GNAT superfamily N-acetyltransferase